MTDSATVNRSRGHELDRSAVSRVHDTDLRPNNLRHWHRTRHSEFFSSAFTSPPVNPPSRHQQIRHRLTSFSQEFPAFLRAQVQGYIFVPSPSFAGPPPAVK